MIHLSFSLRVLVRNAELDVVRTVRKHSPFAQVSRQGTLVVPLVPDRELSHAIFPDEWKVNDSGTYSRFAPDFSSGVVHNVYDPPEELIDILYQTVLEEAEVHDRSYCQIVTNYEGERLQPYRRESSRGGWSNEYSHPTASVFSAPKMGLLRFDRGLRFTIQRATIETVDGILTTSIEQLLYDEGPWKITQRLTSIPSGLEAWMPALTAVLDRYQCKLEACQGHYHL